MLDVPLAPVWKASHRWPQLALAYLEKRLRTQEDMGTAIHWCPLPRPHHLVQPPPLGPNSFRSCEIQ